jgi:hypothetical protein
MVNFQNNPTWQPVKEAKKLTPGPLGKGSKFRQTFDFRGSRQSIDCVVTDYQPGRKFSYRYESSLASSDDEYHFAEVDGATQVVIRGKMKFAWLYRMSEPLAAPHLQKQAESSLRDLKHILENQYRATARS